ncbi:MAG TPA: TonB-dependent receptor [Mucilaginibacter sp.]|nr:TonB-dependent receptor [Mucilaginibacter sp.]
MKKKLLILLVLLITTISVVTAQAQTVTGKVTDQKDGLPLPGVSVTVKGLSAGGTQTTLNGSYSITVPAGSHTLVFRYIGYKQVERPVTGSTVDVQLETDSKQLSEVVVVGYGTQKRASITGSIATVSGKETENVPVTTFEQALQGKTAGVNIQANNGKLGQGIKISVRGTASISGGTQPLVVIDGIIANQIDLSNNGATSDPLADLNFNDVESFQVLKDAAASAIYGARGSNGVIIITTKKGKLGAAKINFNAQFGYSKPSGYRKFLNTQQWLQLEERAAVGAAPQDVANGFEPDLETALADEKDYIEGKFTSLSAGSTDWTKNNTDWQKQAFRTAPQQQYDLNFTGGTEKTTYFIGGQALNQTGILKGNQFQRYSGRVNIDTKIFSSLDVGMNLNFTHTFNKRVGNDDSFATPLQIVALSPVTPVIDPRTGLISGTPPGSSSSYPLYYNPLISVDNAYFHTNVYRTLGNVFANWDIVDHLTFRSEFGVDQTNQNEDSYFSSLTARDTGTPHGFGRNTNSDVVNFTVNNYLTYKNTLARDHSLDLTVGNSYQYSHSTANDVQGQQFPSDAYKQIASAAVISAGSSSQAEFSFVSYFARANYAYKGRYLLSGSVRSDGSSRFGINNRYGIFPAGSIGWILSEEDFMKKFNSLSSLKIRASYGLTGNAEIGNYAALGLFSGNAGYNGVAGQSFFQLQNPDLKWEKTAQVDIGLDWGFFNNRLSGSFDFYRKNTRDLLLNVNIPETLGIGTQLQNLGKLYNQGFEITLSSENFVGKFKWSTNFNASYNKNVVTYVQGQIINEGADLNRVIEGQPIGVFYGREYAGVDPANGDAIFYLNTKNADGTLNRGTTSDYNAAQNVPLGDPTPHWTGGITNNFAYKGFDLSFTIYGSFGNKIYNGGGQYMSAEASNGLDNQTIDQMRYWDKPGDITDIPEPRLFYANGTDPSSRYLSSGSYVRLKTATLGYTFPKAVLAKLKIDRLRIFVNGFNLFKITKYKGWDPEVNTDFLATNVNLGNDFYSAPQPRTITFGVNVGL